MIYISHRGNIQQRHQERENHPDYVEKALSEGYEVEIDVWKVNETYFLGHDKPEHEVDLSFLRHPKFWCHAKTPSAFESLLNEDVHCFWHQEDFYALTSQGVPWVYPNKKLFKDSVCVMPEWGWFGDITNCLGICSDEIERYRYGNI